MAVRRMRRYSTEFKLQIVEAYLAGEGSGKGLADEHGISHSLVLIWTDKYRRGELTLDMQREEQIQDYEAKIGLLERKVGQLTMELDLLKRGLVAALPRSSESSSIVSGPAASPSRGAVA